MATAFYATRISEHLSRTPEGYLLALGCCLGRTGWQQYAVGDLPQEQAAKLGVDLSNPHASVSLYRPAEEVFHPACLASLNGKPVTLQHPPEFVDPSNYREYNRGHVQNVRQGSEPLQSGDMPILGDLMIKDAELISKVESGLRELSLGYTYVLKREGEKLLQSDIRGNHCAVVTAGRAGPEARIYDAASGMTAAAGGASGSTSAGGITAALSGSDLWDGAPVPAVASIPTAPIDDVALRAAMASLITLTPPPISKPEVRPSTKEGVHKVKNPLADLIGRGLKSMFADGQASPEEIAAASAAAGRALDAKDPEEEKKAADAKRAKDEEEARKKKEAEDASIAAMSKEAADKKARDEAEAASAAAEKERKEKEAKDAAEAESAAKAAKDAEESNNEAHFTNCKAKDCMARDCRMHKTLDSVLKAHPDGEEDLQDLTEMLNSFAAEEAAEQGSDDEAQVIEPISEGSMDADEEDPDKEAKDAAARTAAQDAAHEAAFLKRIRPIVARSNDAAAISEFNARLAKHTRSSKPSTGSYAAVAGAAGKARDKAPSGHPDYSKLQAAYDKRRGKPNSQGN